MRIAIIGIQLSENTILLYIMTAFVGLLIGLAKGGLGGLLGTLATPLMSLVMPPQDVVGLLLPMLIFADVFAVASYWRLWKTRLVILLLPGAVVGVTVGTFFIKNAPTYLLRDILAIIILVFTIYKLLEGAIKRFIPYKPQNWHGILAGTVAGFSSTLAHAGGPPIAIYMLMQKLGPIEYNATVVLFFAILNWIKVPYYASIGLFDFQRLMQVIWLMPVIPLGVFVGRWLAGHINRVLFERIIVIALFVTAIILLLE